MTDPAIMDDGPDAEPRYRVEYPDPPQPTYQVAHELIGEWADLLNENHRLRSALASIIAKQTKRRQEPTE